MGVENGRVCVTGAGGFIASWLVKLLLDNNYIVHGTVRNTNDEKNAHLYKLEKASENLKLFKADLRDYDSLYSAIEGCIGVFHLASPVPESLSVPNPEEELIEPAVKGTLNVLKASLDAKVKRVVYMSSSSAVVLNPDWPKDKPKDETCWSDRESCIQANNWYAVSKTEAEKEVLEFAKRTGLDVNTNCPGLVLGPLLQSKVNTSTLYLLNLFKGHESCPNNFPMIVDVRDVVEAMLLQFEKHEAKGRYICASHVISASDLIDKLKAKYPDYEYPKIFIDGPRIDSFTSEKLQKLGWTYRPLEETLVDSIESYKKTGILIIK